MLFRLGSYSWITFFFFSSLTFVSVMPGAKGIHVIAGSQLSEDNCALKHPLLITQAGFMARLHGQHTVKQQCSRKSRLWFPPNICFLLTTASHIISFLLLFASIWSLRESFASVGLDLIWFYSVSALGTYIRTAVTLPMYIDCTHAYLKKYSLCIKRGNFGAPEVHIYVMKLKLIFC